MSLIEVVLKWLQNVTKLQKIKRRKKEMKKIKTKIVYKLILKPGTMTNN